MNIEQFAIICKARWRLIAGFTLSSLFLVLLFSLVKHAVYEATADVLIDVKTPNTVQMAGDPGVTAQIQPDYLATQADVIRSRRVALAAARRLNLARNPSFSAQYSSPDAQRDPEGFFTDHAVAALKVVPSVNSRLVSISFRSKDPDWAAQVANAFAGGFQDVSLQLQNQPEHDASSWYDQAITRLGSQLQSSEADLAAKRAQLGITASSDQLDDNDTRLAVLSQQLATAQAQQAVQDQRIVGGALPDATINPVIQSLETDKSRLEAQRNQLATYAGPNNPDYKQISSQISALNDQIAKQRATIAQSASSSAAQSDQAVSQLERAVGAQRQRVINSLQHRGEVAALAQKVAHLKTSYQSLVAKQAQSEILAGSGQTNVSVLSPAEVPTHPVGLPWLLKMMLGAIAGFAVGLAAALALEFLDQRMRTPFDSELWLGIPNLGSVRTELPGAGVLRLGVMRYLPGTSKGDER